MDLKAIHPCSGMKQLLDELQYWEGVDRSADVKILVQLVRKEDFAQEELRARVFETADAYRHRDFDDTCVILHPHAASSTTSALFRTFHRCVCMGLPTRTAWLVVAAQYRCLQGAWRRLVCEHPRMSKPCSKLCVVLMVCHVCVQPVPADDANLDAQLSSTGNVGAPTSVWAAVEILHVVKFSPEIFRHVFPRSPSHTGADSVLAVVAMAPL